MAEDGETALATLALSRGYTVSRALLRAIPALALLVVGIWIYRGLVFVPSGTSNRIVDYSIAVILLPVLLIAVILAVAAFRLILLACWPGTQGVFAFADSLVLRLGPYGTRRYDAARLDIRYPFEMSADEEGDSYEALLPMEWQVEQLFPSVTHPEAEEPLDRQIRRFAGRTEIDLVRLLRPAIDHYRRAQGGDGD